MIIVRPATPNDEAFIIDSWKRSYEGAAAVKHADREHYRVEMTRAIRRLCSRATVLVACDSLDPDQLIGFAAFTKPSSSENVELHYIYVKRDFRGMGFARELVKNVKIATYTFLSPTARPPKGWVFTPRFTI